jgi:hypothetical protein
VNSDGDEVSTRIFCLCGDFSMGEVRYISGGHKPVVGAPSKERGDKRVSKVEILEGGKGGVTNLRLTVERQGPTGKRIATGAARRSRLPPQREAWRRLGGLYTPF